MGMSVSVKKATNKTSIKHNNRAFNERDKERNSHIDYSRSHENKYLVRENIRDLYEREFGQALGNYNNKQKRNDRKINNYFKHIEASKKTAIQQELVIQIGDKNDFSSKVNRELANEILEEWFDDFEKRNPNLKVYNAVIHNDEASPHMHLNFVPVASGYKRGLEKQVAFDKAIKQQDSTLNKTRPFDDWRDNEVQSLEKKLQERGIERKIVGTNQYKDVNDYKEKKDLEKELQKLNKQILEKKNEMKNMSLILPEQLEIKAKKEMETVIEDKIVHFGKPKTFQKETGNIVVDGEDYKMMCKVVRAAATVKKDYDRLQDSDLVRENNDLRKLVIETRDENVSVRKKNRQLNHHLKEAHEEIWLLKDHISDLKLDIKLVYQSAKEFVKEHTDGLKAFRGVFKGFVDKVKDKTVQFREKHDLEIKKNEFEITHNLEVNKEQDRGMER